MAKTVHTTISKGVCQISLNRPEHLNALNWTMLEELTDTVSLIERDDRVRCVIIRGEGQHFMAGGDINYFHDLLNNPDIDRKAQFRKLISAVHQFVEKLDAMSVPVIAQVRGAAAGFGISLVAGCDIAVASKNSFYTSAYNLLGTSPDGGSTYYLPRCVSMKKAMEIVLTTNRYNAEEAVQMGLVNKVVDDSDLEQEVMLIATQISQSSAVSVKNCKRLIRDSYRHSLTEQLENEIHCFLESAVTDDFAEGVSAFVEKRSPRFK